MSDIDHGKARLSSAIDFPFSHDASRGSEDARWWMELSNRPSVDDPAPDPANPLAAFTEWLWHTETTPVHEAGHAVAMTLTGRRVRDLRVFAVPRADALGMVRPEPLGLTVSAAARSPTFGPHGLARELVMTFAGPAAELRYDPSRYHSGRKGDWASAQDVAFNLHDLGYGNMFTYLRSALVEAHLMMMDERVWAAVTEIADAIKVRSFERVAAMSGKRISAIVQKHLPDGWPWSGIFEAPTSSERRAA